MSETTNHTVGVFISYSHEDRLTAEMFAERIEELGYQPWIDIEGMVGGEAWKEAIHKALQQSVALIVLLTPEAAGSRWVLYEIEHALKNNLTIIPVIIRPCTVPEVVGSLHFIDFHRLSTKQAFNDLQRALLRAVIQQGNNKEDTKPNFDRGTLKQEVATRQSPPQALVIEDVPETQEVIKNIMLELGLNVHVAGTRNEATRYIRNHNYDFITLDMQLGPDDERDEDERGQEGLYLLNLLNRYQADAPIVMITSVDWDKNETAEFFVINRIKDLLDKPINRERLRQLVLEHVHGIKQQR